MRNLCGKIKDCVPIWCLIIFALTIFSAIIYFFCILFEAFASFINQISLPARASLAFLSSFIPFSLAEIFIIFLPLWVVLLFFLVVKVSKTNKGSIRFLSILCSFFCLYFVFFVWTIASGYHMKPIEEKIGLKRERLSNQDVYDATIILNNELNSLVNEVEYDKNGASKMPYSYRDMSRKIVEAYKSFSKETGIISNFDSLVKPLILSKPLMYANLSGVYISLTGEANVNTFYPDFVVIFSAAHEMAHQRGIAREDEASFVAFLVSTYSEDRFFKYSVYLNVFIDLILELKNRDSELYKSALEKIDKRVINDYNEFSTAFEKYSGSIASNVSDGINNTYLQLNGTKEGTSSYHMVSELVALYLINK